MDSGLTTDWSLHPQLVLDTVPVGDLPLTRVLLASDANYPWLILVPRLPGLIELIKTGNHKLLIRDGYVQSFQIRMILNDPSQFRNICQWKIFIPAIFY